MALEGLQVCYNTHPDVLLNLIAFFCIFLRHYMMILKHRKTLGLMTWIFVTLGLWRDVLKSTMAIVCIE